MRSETPVGCLTKPLELSQIEWSTVLVSRDWFFIKNGDFLDGATVYRCVGRIGAGNIRGSASPKMAGLQGLSNWNPHCWPASLASWRTHGRSGPIPTFPLWLRQSWQVPSAHHNWHSSPSTPAQYTILHPLVISHSARIHVSLCHVRLCNKGCLSHFDVKEGATRISETCVL